MQEYIPLILSTLVSIIAVLATFFQTYTSRRTKLNEIYFSAQLSAYQKLFQAIAHLDADIPPGAQRDFRPLIETGQMAMLVSTRRNAETINHFCAVYMEYLIASDTDEIPEKLLKDFADAKFALTTLLQDELLRFDSGKRKSDKYFKKVNQVENTDHNNG